MAKNKYVEGGRVSDVGIPAIHRAKKTAGAGRGFVNPQRTDETDESYVTPKQRYDMERDLIDAKEAAAAEKAYNKAAGMKSGGSVSSASKRADGIAQRGKTRGTTVVMCGGGYAKRK